MDKFLPDRKNITNRAFGKQISKKTFSKYQGWGYDFFPPIKFGHEYRFEKLTVKFLCEKVFGSLLFS